MRVARSPSGCARAKGTDLLRGQKQALRTKGMGGFVIGAGKSGNLLTSFAVGFVDSLPAQALFHAMGGVDEQERTAGLLKNEAAPEKTTQTEWDRGMFDGGVGED